MPSYVFLCDATTETECLNRRLVGTTQQNALRALNIRPGDTKTRSMAIPIPLVWLCDWLRG